MLITKENQRRIKTIAIKMGILGFGSKKVLIEELTRRYVDLELEKLNKQGGD